MSSTLRGLAVPLELDVREHPENVLLVVREVLPGLLIGVTQEDLRTCLDAQQLVGDVHSLRHQTAHVLDDLRVDCR